MYLLHRRRILLVFTSDVVSASPAAPLDLPPSPLPRRPHRRLRFAVASPPSPLPRQFRLTQERWRSRRIPSMDDMQKNLGQDSCIDVMFPPDVVLNSVRLTESLS